MKKTVIIYGSDTGTCEDLARRIGAKLGVTDIIDAARLTPADVAGADNLLLGTCTMGAGEMQDDWYDAVKTLCADGLAGKTVAIFGCGDCEGYPDTFCGGMGQLRHALDGTGATFVGQVPTDGYSFDDSEAVEDGMFTGLALDEINEDGQTDDRIAAWVEQLRPSL